LLEYNIPSDITGGIEPKLNSIYSISGIRGYGDTLHIFTDFL
jgi:hypothetical protein